MTHIDLRRGDPMGARMSDEYLAWLAVRDQLSRKARRGSFLARLLGLGRRSAGFQSIGSFQLEARRDGEFIDAGSQVNEMVSDRMSDYALAVDAATAQLSSDDRRRLRETGEVPVWFLDQVEHEMAELRRRR